MTQSPELAEATLQQGLVALSLPDAPRVARVLMQYAALLLDANKRTNLVGPVDLDKLIVHHLLDSLAPLASRRFRPPIVDVGSGAGLPGIPVAIVYPRASMTLIEPRRLRAEFLESTVRALDLSNVQIVRSAAESVGRSAASREQAGTVLMRAIGKPEVALELGLPLLKHSGELWLYRGRDTAPDKQALDVANLLGGALASSHRIEVPGLEADRHLWVFRKVTPTPKGYPRRSGIPDRDPIRAVK